VLKILLIAKKSPLLGFTYDLFLIMTVAALLSIISVKIVKTWRQSAGVRSISTFEASQRLHAGDLSADYITGFCLFFILFYFNTIKDCNIIKKRIKNIGESSFHISVLKNDNKTGYHIMPIFSIQLHSKDFLLLSLLKSYFNVGTLKNKNNKNKLVTVIYSVQSVKDLINVIIPHFEKYPLITQKRADYLLFKQIVNLMNDSKHLTKEGLNEILSLKASMNKGLNEKLKKDFNIVAIQRPLVESSARLTDDWLAGFVEGEACFLCLVRKNLKHKIGYQVTLSFTLGQHIRDLILITKIKDYLGLGIIYKNNSVVILTITRKSDIDNLITILKGKLLGAKLQDFVRSDFVKIQEIIDSGLHKSNEGLENILKIKNRMNKGRKYE
jgi:hypothetical protein